jgi:hypothetical protein
MPDHIPWERAQDFAEKNGCSRVVIVAFDGERTHVVTWGLSVEDSDVACDVGNWFKEENDWPARFEAESPKVKALREQIAHLQGTIGNALL